MIREYLCREKIPYSNHIRQHPKPLSTAYSLALAGRVVWFECEALTDTSR